MTSGRIFLIAFLLLGSAASLSGCQKKDSDKIAETQDCLDRAGSDEAMACLSKLDGVESEAASLLRCSAHMIYQQFTDPARLVKISEQLKGTSGTAADSTSIALGLLAFTKPTASTAAARATLAAEAFTHCAASGSKGMTLLAAAARIGSEISTVAPALVADCDTNDPSYDADTCKATVQTASCTASPSVLGSTALATYQQSCLGSSQQNSSVCSQFQTATNGTTDPTTIGTNLQTQMGCP